MSNYLFGIVGEWDDANACWYVDGVLNSYGKDFIALSKEQFKDVKLSINQLVVFRQENIDYVEGVGLIVVDDMITDVAPILPSKLPMRDEQATQHLVNAVKKKDLERVKRLLENGANQDSLDAEGNSALLHAVVIKEAPIIEMLALYGADPHIRNSSDICALSFAEERAREVLPSVRKAEKQWEDWVLIRRYLSMVDEENAS